MPFLSETPTFTTIFNDFFVCRCSTTKHRSLFTMPTCLKLIALSAVVVVVSVRLKQFSTIFKKPEIILAHHDEHLFHQVSQEVVCSEDYQRDTYVGMINLFMIIVVMLNEATQKMFSVICLEHIGWLVRMSVLDTEVDGSNPGSSMLFP